MRLAQHQILKNYCLVCAFVDYDAVEGVGSLRLDADLLADHVLADESFVGHNNSETAQSAID